MEPGTYTLLLELETAQTIEFGAAGPRDLQAGYYAYTGSAFGPGGLSRVDRHQEVASGERDTRHWHIDYLLGNESVTYLDHWLGLNQDSECHNAGQIEGETLPGLGATDCGCAGHIVFNPAREPLVRSIEGLYD